MGKGSINHLKMIFFFKYMCILTHSVKFMLLKVQILTVPLASMQKYP